MKNQIKVIAVILLSVLMLTACGESASSIKLPMGLKFGDSYEKIYDAMSKVGKTVVIDHDGEYESLKSYVLHGDDTASISYLGCEWGVECMANEDGLFDVCLDLSVKVYDMNESGFTSTQILEMGMDGYCLYFTQNEDDAQLLFNAYGGMKPDFLE